MFLANYKDVRITLTETVLVSFLSWTLDKFLFPGVFQIMVLFERSKILEEMYDAVSSWLFIVKT